MRRRLVVVLACALLTACSSGQNGGEPAERAALTSVPPAPPPSFVPTQELAPNKGPNILVVTTDDMRWDELRYTPNVRKYVTSRGLLFRNSFAPNPLCCPSRASFLLGQYSHNHRVYSHEVPYGFAAFDDHLTGRDRAQRGGVPDRAGRQVPQRLRQAAVEGDRRARRPPTCPDGWTDWMVSIEKRWPVGSPYRGGTYNYQSFTQNVNGKVVGNRGTYSSVVVGDEVQSLIGKYDGTGHPWFIWATPVAPHLGGPAEPDDPKPYRTDVGTLSRFDTPPGPTGSRGKFDDVITRAPGVRPGGKPVEQDVSDKPEFVQKLPELVGAERRALVEVERQRAEALFAWDRQLGRIMQKLKDTGQYDDTVIVFTSDNGYFMGEHRQRSGKIKPYEPSLRVPLVVAGPGIPHGVRDAPITTIDLTATILDLASASLPDVDGTSAVPTFAADRPVDRARGDRGPATAAARRGRLPRRPHRRSGCAPAATPTSATPPARASSTT
jgi:hypothetical protein